MLRLGLILAAVVAMADQLTKWWASDFLPGNEITIIPEFFDFMLVHNPGAAFGLFSDLTPTWRALILIGVAGGASALIVNMLRNTASLWVTFSLGLVLGGAVGNLIDRLRFGWVVDFIHLHWHAYSWPVFNLADSAITVGIGMLLWDNLRNPE